MADKKSKKGFFKSLTNFANKGLEIIQTASSLSWAGELIRGARIIGEDVAPTFTADVKRKIQKTQDGPLDETNFQDTVLQLDGNDPKKRSKPLADNIDSFLSWLRQRDRHLRIIFIDFVGRQMEDVDLRFKYLMRIAQIEDSNGHGRSDEANQLRYDLAFNHGILHMPESQILKFFGEHPEIKNKLMSLKDKSVTLGGQVISAVASKAISIDIATNAAALRLNRKLDRDAVKTRRAMREEEKRIAKRTFVGRLWNAIRPKSVFPESIGGKRK